MSFGLKNLVKIEGRNFFNLTPSEVAEMIDAYLSGGSERFHAAALPEFMLVPNKTDWLERLRLEIMNVDASRAAEGERDGLASVDGREDLVAIARSIEKATGS